MIIRNKESFNTVFIHIPEVLFVGNKDLTVMLISGNIKIYHLQRRVSIHSFKKFLTLRYIKYHHNYYSNSVKVVLVVGKKNRF